MAKIDEKIERWLRACRWPEKHIQRFTPATEMPRDMESLGDTADEELTVLRDMFHVDFTHFSFGEHFPTELSRDAVWMTFCKWLGLRGYRDRIVKRYRPITLDYIRGVMDRGAWPPQ